MKTHRSRSAGGVIAQAKSPEQEPLSLKLRPKLKASSQPGAGVSDMLAARSFLSCTLIQAIYASRWAFALT